MWLLFIVPLLLSIPLLLARATSLQKAPFGKKDRVLLVVAHPDDESMFFAPTILSLTLNGIPVSVLCLSNGGAYGKGKVRAEEMVAACMALQIPSSDVIIVDDPKLQDGMKTDWPADAVAAQVHAAVQKYKPTRVITFDARGISGHVNHVSTYRGVRQYMQDRQYGVGAPIIFYMLESTNMARKFSGLLDLPVSSLLMREGSHLLVSPNPSQGVAAMQLHKSQFVWYRMLFVMLSRYTMINTLHVME